MNWISITWGLLGSDPMILPNYKMSRESAYYLTDIFPEGLTGCTYHTSTVVI